MGACEITLDLAGHLTADDVKEAFKEQQKHDARYNGHREGYSGDFQTVDSVLIHDKVFNTENEACKYCLEHAEKFRYAIAVKYKVVGKVKPTPKLKMLQKKIKLAQKQLDKAIRRHQLWVTKVWDKRKPLLDKKKSFKCVYCKSTINLRFGVHAGIIRTCPVCHEGLYTKAQFKREHELGKSIRDEQYKLDKIFTKLSQVGKKLYDEAAEKSDKTRWLIAGWGAC